MIRCPKAALCAKWHRAGDSQINRTKVPVLPLPEKFAENHSVSPSEHRLHLRYQFILYLWNHNTHPGRQYFRTNCLLHLICPSSTKQISNFKQTKLFNTNKGWRQTMTLPSWHRSKTNKILLRTKHPKMR